MKKDHGLLKRKGGGEEIILHKEEKSMENKTWQED
jgi:hypothetical protein